MTLNWLIDFNETLASGNLSWALENAFPRLIREHGLTFDAERLHQAMLAGQEQSKRERSSPRALVHTLFETMGWPEALEQPLLDDVLANARPTLYEDTLPFLTRLKSLGKRILVVSNNPASRQNVTALGLEALIDGIYTPADRPGVQPKPHRSLWEAVLAADPLVTPENAAIIGDDPWSDGAFAANCGIPCWIVDRRGRFHHLRQDQRFHWVEALSEIPVASG
jgi:FMN phosphatase YigB (HAD superfamily)